VVLINSVLSSILVAPKAIVNQIDALLRIFLWEGGKNWERKIHLVNWDKVKAPKKE